MEEAPCPRSSAVSKCWTECAVLPLPGSWGVCQHKDVIFRHAEHVPLLLHSVDVTLVTVHAMHADVTREQKSCPLY